MITACDPDTQYVVSAPTATSNQVCAALQGCNLTVEYFAQDPTPTSDAVCSPLTVCAPVGLAANIQRLRW